MPMKELFRRLKVHAFFAAVVVVSAFSYIADRLRIKPRLAKENEL